MADGTENEIAAEVPDGEATIQRITPDGRPIFYANIVALGSTVWDFTMDFGMILEAGGNRLRFQDVARVVMSPQQARVFSEVLVQHVKQYEDKFGKIPRPPDDALLNMGSAD